MILDLLNFLLMMVATIGPLYMAYRVRKRSQRLFMLTTLLVSFTLIHGCAHLLVFVGMDFIAGVVFWPASAVILLCFGFFYWKMGV
ncbi:MAG TPA: hypothetical protein VK503_00995 [Candidatus Bathyarchaeia archaeon]|nr:hypothetical protein [Candidatus Bathyarchaeia archaeon]